MDCLPWLRNILACVHVCLRVKDQREYGNECTCEKGKGKEVCQSQQ